MSGQRQLGRERRHRRSRKYIAGTAERPRLALFRGSKRLNVQLINDEEGKTIMGLLGGASNIKGATDLGGLIAQKAKEKGVIKVVFDRGGNQYHGVVKAFATSARTGGLDF